MTRILISLESYNAKHLNQSTKKLVELFLQPKILNIISFKGPILFPTHRRIYCVLRSPFINKDSREQFEIRRYKRLLEVYAPTLKKIENLLRVSSISEGIEIKILIVNNNKKKKKINSISE